MAALSAPTAIGVIGASWSASVEADASIVIYDQRRQRSVMRFAVASTDRWHDPGVEPTLRRRCLDGTPVVELRMHVPGGDVAVTVYGVPALSGHGGIVVLAVSNDSGAPVAFACSDPRATGTRPAADVPVEGIDLGADAVSFPIGHRSAIKVAIPVGDTQTVALGRVPEPDRVAHGWVVQCELGARYQLADWSEEVTGARCALLLAGARAVNHIDELLAMDELHQMGQRQVGEWVDRVATDGEMTAKRLRDDPYAAVALRAAARLLRVAGQWRAANDAARLAGGLHQSPLGDELPEEPTRFLHWVRSRIVAETDTRLTVFPTWPEAWNGAGAEVHDLHTDEGVLSAAVRWHGERPALLWDYRGAKRTIACPGLDNGWSSDEPRGEALLRIPATGRR
jgi:hypothetical protein